MPIPKSLLDERPKVLKQEFRLLCASPMQIAREGWRLAEVFRVESSSEEEPDIAGLYLAEVLEQLSNQVYRLTEEAALPDDPHPRSDHEFIWEEYDETVQ
jgi:hypothetical protein